MKFTYLKQPPRKYTFEMPKVKKWVEDNCEGWTLNLFAGKTRLNINELRNDIDDTMCCEHQMDAFEFVKYWKRSNGLFFDSVILDPPYAYRKSMEKYNGHVVSKYKKLLDILPDIMIKNGKTIAFGYRSIHMGKIRGFKQEEILLINHSGAFHDTIAIIEKKI